MSTNALAIIQASLEDLGVIGMGMDITAEMQAQGLSRLNALVSGLQTQTGTVTAVERTIFPVVANKQSYTIGLGGDFNVPRPLSIPGAGLWLNGLNAAASCTIARVGLVATVTAVAHGLAVGDEAYIDGANEVLYNGLQTVQTVPDADTFTFTVEGTPATPATGTITFASVQGVPVEIPRAVITDDSYQSLQLKNMSNSQFTEVYYNPTFPFGTVFLWPRPNTAANQLILYLQNVFTQFADLTTRYDFPSLPGYFEMLQYQLDLRLAPVYARPVTQQIAEMASMTMGLIKRGNLKLTDLSSDAALLTWNRRYGYNINTGTGG